MNSIRDCYTLSNGVKIPCIGYGTYKAADGNSADIMRRAIEAGYRYFDTASFYETEVYLAEAIAGSGIPREEFFVTSKAWKTELGYKEVKEAFARTLERLQTDYLDMYLLHWPLPTPDTKDWKQIDIDSWHALEELYEAGKIRSIGLSNFLPHHIKNILTDCRIPPMADQLEFHPGYTQDAAVRYCKEHGILVQAWSPIGRRRVLNEPLILELAEKYQVSPAQLCLRFAVQQEVVPLPKSASPERMKENQDVFSFEIEKEDMYRLLTMPQTGWSGEHPDRETVCIDK